MTAKDLLPKDIFDDTNLERIRALSEEDFAAISFDLLSHYPKEGEDAAFVCSH